MSCKTVELKLGKDFLPEVMVGSYYGSIANGLSHLIAENLLSNPKIKEKLSVERRVLIVSRTMKPLRIISTKSPENCDPNKFSGRVGIRINPNILAEHEGCRLDVLAFPYYSLLAVPNSQKFKEPVDEDFPFLGHEGDITFTRSQKADSLTYSSALLARYTIDTASYSGLYPSIW